VAIGALALTTDSLGSHSTAVGRGALRYQSFTTATDSNNTAVGFSAGEAVTTGTNNTLMGANTGDALTIGTDNVVIGRSALTTDDVGSQNVAIGSSALESQNAPGATVNNMLNVAVGFEAGKAVTEGYFNTLIGGKAGAAITTGTNNVVVGSLAGDAMTTGSNNVFVGYGSASDGTVTGQDNTAIGIFALEDLTSGSNNLCLGHDSGRTGSPGGVVTTHSNEIHIADENIASAHIQVALTVASDQRDKTDFVDLDLGLDFVKALEPVTYYWDKRSKYGDKYADDYDLNAQTPDGTHKEDWMDVGFKAQSVLALEEAAGYKIAEKKNLTVSLSGDGKQYGLQYEKFIPILVKAIQDQDAIITALTARIAALES